MDNEDVILDQMEETRTSLTEKLESLEKQVTETVQGATHNVTDTVEAVKETVEAVRDKVQETVDAVKDTVQETVSSVRGSVTDTINTVKDTMHEGWSAVQSAFDVPGLVEAHPWAMLGGSVAVGFLLEGFLPRFSKPSVDSASRRDRYLPPDHYSGETVGASAPTRSLVARLLETFEPEIKNLKALALGSLMTTVRDTVTRAAPENMTDKLTEILDSISEKIGAESLSASSDENKRRPEHMGNGRHAEPASREI